MLFKLLSCDHYPLGIEASSLEELISVCKNRGYIGRYNENIGVYVRNASGDARLIEIVGINKYI